jgi:hypothetical protein
MSYDRRSNVNAALIHEIRMIVQTFLVSRSFSGPFTRPSKKATTMKCVFCLRAGSAKPNDAVAVSNGQTVCDQHVSSALTL